MKILFLSTSSNETDKYAASLSCLNPEQVEIVRYDVAGFDDGALYRRAAEMAPSFIVYIGSRWGAVISPLALAQLNQKVAPTVHICSDAADIPWHDLLIEYHYAGSFALQVAIDGNPAWPCAKSGLTALTPVDPKYFNGVRPHAARKVDCGFAGNPGNNGSWRRYLLSEMMFHKALDMRLRFDAPETYPAYCEYLMDCRVSLNLPHTGSGVAMHVKGRVVETGLAGGCLLEMKNSPTAHWFTPGEDYAEYENIGDAIEVARRLKDNPEGAEAMGRRLREKVLAEHGPLKFWTRVCERVAVKP